MIYGILTEISTRKAQHCIDGLVQEMRNPGALTMELRALTHRYIHVYMYVYIHIHIHSCRHDKQHIWKRSYMLKMHFLLIMLIFALELLLTGAYYHCQRELFICNAFICIFHLYSPHLRKRCLTTISIYMIASQLSLNCHWRLIVYLSDDNVAWHIDIIA